MKPKVNYQFDFPILSQPNNTTCGPTCLQAVYAYYGKKLTLQKVINEVRNLKEGGTLGVMLALHALKQGFRSHIYTYNMQVFDPLWFQSGKENLQEILIEKLKLQLKYKRSEKMRVGTLAYIEYLKLGGTIGFTDLEFQLLKNHLDQSIPILTGLSATYLYNSAREYGRDCVYDDVRGEPSGHFVVLCGYKKNVREVIVADPHPHNPVGTGGKPYSVGVQRLINAILLGILTYDANLVILQPKDSR